MKSTIFCFILAMCLSAKPITATNRLRNSSTPKAKDIGAKVFWNNDVQSKEDSSSNKSHQENFDLVLTNTHRYAKVSLPNKVKNILPFNVKEIIYRYYNDPFLRSYSSFEEGMENLLPYFFDHNKQVLEKLQEGNRQAVVVIGQTGSGKSTLIGGLLGHKFETQKKEIIRTLKNGMKMSFKDKVLVNKNSVAPTIGHSTAASETTFPQAYLDKKTNLAFIDTAGLSDTRKNGEVINTCSAIGLRSLIEAIGSVQCFIGAIDYKAFDVGRGSNAFMELLRTIGSLLKNKSLEECTSSIVLAFTKVPENITKEAITNDLKKRCFDLMVKEENNRMTEQDKIVDNMYKILFPSFYGINNKKNVPFVLISENSLLKQSFVRKNILPTLQNSTKIDKKDIGLVLAPVLLQKTTDWLAKKAEPVAKDIRSKERTEENKCHIALRLSFTKTQLSNLQKRLQQLTYSDSKDKMLQKENTIKSLNDMIQNNAQRIEELDKKIEKNKQEQDNKEKEKNLLDTNEVKLYKSISGRYDKQTKQYKYSYNDVPINYIIYKVVENKILAKLFNEVEKKIDKSLHIKKKDPEPNSRVSVNYKVVSITKNYRQGILNIALENNIGVRVEKYITWMSPLTIGISVLGAGLLFAFTGGIGMIVATSAVEAMVSGSVGSLGLAVSIMKLLPPDDFSIYAQKKDIYRNKINTLEEAAKNAKENWDKLKNDKKRLEKETKLSKEQRDKLDQDLLNKEELIKQTEKKIKIKKKEIENMELDLNKLSSELEPLTEKVKQNEIIPYTITEVAPFIGFHDNQKHNIDACKRYMDSVRKNNNNNNDLVVQINDTIIENNLDDNTNDKFSDNQFGLSQGNNNSIEDEEEIKEDDSYKENISSSSNRNTSIISSVGLGTIGLVSNWWSSSKD